MVFYKLLYNVDSLTLSVYTIVIPPTYSCVHVTKSFVSKEVTYLRELRSENKKQIDGEVRVVYTLSDL